MTNQATRLKPSHLAAGLALLISGHCYAEQGVIDLQQTFGQSMADGKTIIAADWQYVGQASFAPKGHNAVAAWEQRPVRKNSQQSVQRQTVADQETSFDAKTIRRWNAVNLETGEQYLVELPAQTANALSQLAERSGWNAGDAGTDTITEPSGAYESEAYNLKGWSNRIDTRTRRANNTTYPYRAMGQIGGGPGSGCSGTLVGRRHVLTAAHCLYDMVGDEWILSDKFRPGREGECDNAACQPYGEYRGVWYFTPEQFRDDNYDFRKYDYGMMVLNASPGTGWLGYVATSQNTIRSYCDEISFGPGVLGGDCHNRGYPACDLYEAPFNCQQGWAYQDVNACEIGGFFNTGGDGWASRFDTNCDMSRGHSGSAVFTDVWNGSGKVIFGIFSTQDCQKCSTDSVYVNELRRITPEVIDMITFFKADMP